MRKLLRVQFVTRGFTLLELLVVLSIVALTTGLILPSASRWLAAARERGWQQEVHAELTALPIRAFRSGEPMSLDAAGLQKLLRDQLPAGATVELEAPLRYSAAGVAAGGIVKVRASDGKSLRWVVAPATGEVSP